MSHESREGSGTPERIDQKIGRSLRTRLAGLLALTAAIPFEAKYDLPVQEFGAVIFEPQVVNSNTKPIVPRCKYQTIDGTCSFNFWKGRGGMPSLAVYAQDPKTSINSAEYATKLCISADKPEDQRAGCDQYDGTPMTIKKIGRPEDYMENPYIGKDGRDYHTLEALMEANREQKRQLFPKNINNLKYL